MDSEDFEPFWWCPLCERERSEEDKSEGNSCGMCGTEMELVTFDKMIECPGCSAASGSDRPVFHAPPICRPD